MKADFNLVLKERAKAACLEKLHFKIQICHKQLNAIQYDLSNETKSSAGDKYETGRAMLQIEREKLGNQLAELEKLDKVLSSIVAEKEHSKIQLGSLVRTTKLNYFIAVSLGETVVDDFHFYAISKQTPIATILLTKVAGEQIRFRDQSFEIIEVC